MAALVAVMIMVSIGTFSWDSLRNLKEHPLSTNLVMVTAIRSSWQRTTGLWRTGRRAAGITVLCEQGRTLSRYQEQSEEAESHHLPRCRSGVLQLSRYVHQCFSTSKKLSTKSPSTLPKPISGISLRLQLWVGVSSSSAVKVQNRNAGGPE